MESTSMTLTASVDVFDPTGLGEVMTTNGEEDQQGSTGPGANAHGGGPAGGEAHRRFGKRCQVGGGEVRRGRWTATRGGHATPFSSQPVAMCGVL